MEDFITVATHLSMADAEPERLALEAAGISTIATDEDMGSLLGSSVVGGIKLQVAAADAARAEEVLQELRAEAQSAGSNSDDADDADDADDSDDADDADDGIGFKCPACKAEIWFPSELRGQVEVCPECGAQVTVPDAPPSPA
jgi:hypothetical protein